MNSIHIRLKKYRLHHKLTIQEVSKLTGIPASTYKEWEHGRQIRGEPYMSLAKVYQVSLQELITGEKTMAGPLLHRLDNIVHEIQLLRDELIARF